MTWRLLGTYPPLNPRNVRDDLAAAIPSTATRARTVARSRVPGVTVTGSGEIEFRDIGDVKSEMDAEAARVEPLLTQLSVEDLFDFRPLIEHD